MTDGRDPGRLAKEDQPGSAWLAVAAVILFQVVMGCLLQLGAIELGDKSPGAAAERAKLGPVFIGGGQ